jgi:hypothetical protein
LAAKTATARPKGAQTETVREGGDGVLPTPTRRVPTWAVALVGLVLGVGFGAGVERMLFGPPLIMVALGGMTLALSGMALWRVIDPLTRPEATLGRETRGPGRARELEREKQAVLKAIKEIELDHQMRKIADGDYRELIERYRGRAMRLISEIEAGDNFRELIERELKDRLAGDKLAPASPAVTATVAAPPAAEPVAAGAVAATPAAANACNACGTTNDHDARFCKKCGLKLAA